MFFAVLRHKTEHRRPIDIFAYSLSKFYSEKLAILIISMSAKLTSFAIIF